MPLLGKRRNLHQRSVAEAEAVARADQSPRGRHLAIHDRTSKSKKGIAAVCTEHKSYKSYPGGTIAERTMFARAATVSCYTLYSD